MMVGTALLMAAGVQAAGWRWSAAKSNSAIAIDATGLVATVATPPANYVLAATDTLGAGKWCWEIYVGTASTYYDPAGTLMIGLYASSQGNPGTDSAHVYSQYFNAYFSQGKLDGGGTFATFGETFRAGDTIGVAFDTATGRVWYAKNGVWQGDGNPAAGTSPAQVVYTGYGYCPCIGFRAAGDSVTAHFSSGLSYAIPSGFSPITQG